MSLLLLFSPTLCLGTNCLGLCPVTERHEDPVEIELDAHTHLQRSTRNRGELPNAQALGRMRPHTRYESKVVSRTSYTYGEIL